MKNKSLEHFWNRERKSQKSSTSSSPLSNEFPMDESMNEQGDKDSPPTSSEEVSRSEQGENEQEDVDLLRHDPGKRKPISSYPINDRDRVRKGFIDKGPCRPKPIDDFPQTSQGKKPRCFNVHWYDEFDWLEYSVQNDALYCFYCYLFADHVSKKGGDAFVNGGWRNWSEKEKLTIHVGGVGSAHNEAKEKYNLFTNKKTSIIEKFEDTSNEAKSRLTYSLRCVRFLLNQGLAFHGHNESENSTNRGNFLELLKWLAGNSNSVDKVVLANALENHHVTSPCFQKDLIKCCAKETTKVIVDDLNGDLFGILAEVSTDVSHKEQLTLCLRYVNKKGKVCERILGIVEVEDTTSLTLMSTITKLLSDGSLSMSNIRGQSYDRASNMGGAINGLKKMIMRNTPSAYYVHCFAHQLQSILVAVAKDNCDCASFFQQLGYVLNVIGTSCKRLEMVGVVQAQKVLEDFGELESGQGLNQELGLSWLGDYFKSILNLIVSYSTIIDVLVMVGEDAKSADDRVKAQEAVDHLESFDFVFMLHLMKDIFGYNHVLCNALQRRDQVIANAMIIVSLTKDRLQNIRDNGWDNFLHVVGIFCAKHEIEIPNMSDFYAPRGRSRRFFAKVTNLHRFRIEMFQSVIDLQLQDLNNRFDETNIELLLCMACLDPTNSFASFDKQRLLRLAEFYPNEFSSVDIMKLEFQLEIFVADMRKDSRFRHVKTLGELSTILVETNKHVSYSLVYMLLKLVLILPVAIASVERVSSSMTFVKNKLRNNTGDKLFNNCLVTFIERDLFAQVSDDDVLKRFQDLKSRQMMLDCPWILY